MKPLTHVKSLVALRTTAANKSAALLEGLDLVLPQQGRL